MVHRTPQRALKIEHRARGLRPSPLLQREELVDVRGALHGLVDHLAVEAPDPVALHREDVAALVGDVVLAVEGPAVEVQVVDLRLLDGGLGLGGLGLGRRDLDLGRRDLGLGRGLGLGRLLLRRLRLAPGLHLGLLLVGEHALGLLDLVGDGLGRLALADRALLGRDRRGALVGARLRLGELVGAVLRLEVGRALEADGVGRLLARVREDVRLAALDRGRLRAREDVARDVRPGLPAVGAHVGDGLLNRLLPGLHARGGRARLALLLLLLGLGLGRLGRGLEGRDAVLEGGDGRLELGDLVGRHLVGLGRVSLVVCRLEGC